MLSLHNADKAAPPPTAAAAPNGKSSTDTKDRIPPKPAPAADTKDQKQPAADTNISCVYTSSDTDYFTEDGSVAPNRRGSTISFVNNLTQEQVTYYGIKEICNDGQSFNLFRSIRLFDTYTKNPLYTPMYVRTSLINLDATEIARWEREYLFFIKAHPGKALFYKNEKHHYVRFIMYSLGKQTLADAIDAAKTPAEKLQLYIATLEEIQRLHKLDIIHGDVKAENFVVIDGKVFAIDFEFAHVPGEAVETQHTAITETLIAEERQRLKEACLPPDEEELDKQLIAYQKTTEYAQKVAAAKKVYANLAPEFLNETTLTGKPSRDVYSFCATVLAFSPEFKSLVAHGLETDPNKRANSDVLLAQLKNALAQELAKQNTPAAVPKL